MFSRRWRMESPTSSGSDFEAVSSHLHRLQISHDLLQQRVLHLEERLRAPVLSVTSPSGPPASRGVSVQKVMSNSSTLNAMLLQAMPQVQSHDLILPWEQGPMQLIFGSQPALPELPKVSPAEWPDKVTDEESLERVEEAATLAAPGAVALFQRYTCKLPFKRNLLTLEEKVHLLAQRFELLLSHDYTASSTGLFIQNLPLGERVTCVMHALEGRPRLLSRSAWRQALSTFIFAAMQA